MTTALAIKGGGFKLEPQNMDDAMKMATMLSSSAMVPACYKGKPADTLVAMMMGNELGLNPIQALQNIAVINGKPSIYGDSMLALVQNHPAFDSISEEFDEATGVATCTVSRKGGEKHTQSFSKQDAETARLWGKAGPWTQYPKRMLQMRARGFALRSQFADALAGLISREEAEDMPHEERDVTPKRVTPALDVSLVSTEQVAELRGALGDAGIDESEFCLNTAKIDCLESLPVQRFSGAMKHIAAKGGDK